MPRSTTHNAVRQIDNGNIKRYFTTNNRNRLYYLMPPDSTWYICLSSWADYQRRALRNGAPVSILDPAETAKLLTEFPLSRNRRS